MPTRRPLAATLLSALAMGCTAPVGELGDPRRFPTLQAPLATPPIPPPGAFGTPPPPPPSPTPLPAGVPVCYGPPTHGPVAWMNPLPAANGLMPVFTPANGAQDVDLDAGPGRDPCAPAGGPPLTLAFPAGARLTDVAACVSGGGGGTGVRASLDLSVPGQATLRPVGGLSPYQSYQVTFNARLDGGPATLWTWTFSTRRAEAVDAADQAALDSHRGRIVELRGAIAQATPGADGALRIRLVAGPPVRVPAAHWSQPSSGGFPPVEPASLAGGQLYAIGHLGCDGFTASSTTYLTPPSPAP